MGGECQLVTGYGRVGIQATNGHIYACPTLQYYVEKVEEMAKQMWKDAGFPSGETLAFWVAAENHVLTVACLTVAMANTVADAAENLTKAFATFGADAYLERIRETAYFIWKASGGTSGHALDDWLKAERTKFGQSWGLERRDPVRPGNAYSHRIHGERAGNLEQAIAHYML